MKRKFCIVCLLGFFILLSGAVNAAAGIKADCPGGIVKCGEKVTFKFTGKYAPGTAFCRVMVFINGRCKESRVLPVGELKPVTLALSKPGWLAVRVQPLNAQKQPLAKETMFGDGVLAAPEKIAPARTRPADFDEFWDKKLAELGRIPMEAQRTAVPLRNKKIKNLICEEIKLKSLGDVPVTGYLVMPKNAKKRSLPAVICFHGAGFKSASQQVSFGRHAIAFDVNAHGLPNGRDRAYYLKLNRSSRNKSIYSFRSDRERSYIMQMFLRTVRAVDFVRSMPEWDGKTLIVFGRSQGGAQAIASAALAPGVTMCVANVPALGDHGGDAVGRRPGWPLLNRGMGKKRTVEKGTVETSDYVDVINLASRIRCPVHLTAGLIDFICPPTSVVLVRSNIAPGLLKSFRLFPRMGHEAPPVRDDNRKFIFKEIKK